MQLASALFSAVLAVGTQSSGAAQPPGTPGVQVPAQSVCVLDPPQIDTTNYRPRDVFYLGEKARKQQETGEKEGGGKNGGPCPVRIVGSGGEVNAKGVIDLYVRDDDPTTQNIRNKGWNIILLPQIKKAGESSWLRIEAPNRYYRRIAAVAPDTAAARERYARERTPYGDPSKPLLRDLYGYDGCLRADPQVPEAGVALGPRTQDALFAVNRLELERNEYVREGYWVPVLYYYDLLQKYNCPYLRDLKRAARERRPVLTLDLEALPIVGSKNTAEVYRAGDGDMIRIRILSAEQDIRQRDRALELLEAQAFPDVPQWRHATHVNYLDDIEIEVADYGLGIDIIPALSYASSTQDFDVDQFNPVNTPPAITSLFYLRYRGRNNEMRVARWFLPGVYISLLTIDESTNAKFTAGFAWAPLSMRRWVNLTAGWHDLRTFVVGVAVSPNVDITAYLSREQPGPN